MNAKIVEITGASGGIGLETARQGAGHGAKVAVVRRDPERETAHPRVDVLINNAGAVFG